jgi:hypothetical protein
LRETTVWERLQELRNLRRETDERGPHFEPPEAEQAANRTRSAPAPAHERQFLALVLAYPDLVASARELLQPSEISHPGLRELLQGLYDLLEAGESPDLDSLRSRLSNDRLADAAMNLMEIGRTSTTDREQWLHKIVAVFRQRREDADREDVKNQLLATQDTTAAIALLRRLQQGGSDRPKDEPRNGESATTPEPAFPPGK